MYLTATVYTSMFSVFSVTGKNLANTQERNVQN